RRHTRSKRDWSSDVCSSDLNVIPTPIYKPKNITNGRSAKAPYCLSLLLFSCIILLLIIIVILYGLQYIKKVTKTEILKFKLLFIPIYIISVKPLSNVKSGTMKSKYDFCSALVDLYKLFFLTIN